MQPWRGQGRRCQKVPARVRCTLPMERESARINGYTSATCARADFVQIRALTLIPNEVSLPLSFSLSLSLSLFLFLFLSFPLSLSFFLFLSFSLSLFLSFSLSLSLSFSPSLMFRSRHACVSRVRAPWPRTAQRQMPMKRARGHMRDEHAAHANTKS